MVETYEHWLQRINNMRLYDRSARAQRRGQWLYNNMPNRFVGRVPQYADPFNNEENIPAFLDWLQKNWNY